MGSISMIKGNASRLEVTKIEKEFSKILMEGEKIDRVYKYIRDFFVFTDKRIVIVEKLDPSGNKINYHSVAYNKILHFSIETSGPSDFDHVIKLWCAGLPDPIVWTFNRSIDIFELQCAIAKNAL
jgi:hypothetical protein